MRQDSDILEDDLEGRKKGLREFKERVTTKLSDIVRFIGLGLVAVFYTIKTGSSYPNFNALQDILLYTVGLAGVLSVLLDYIQYVANYESVEAALRRDNFTYDKDSKPYKRAEFAFKWKQRVTSLGAVALIALVLFT
ncbi:MULTISPECIES: hypothetical protein [Mesorhizobium]|uniref:hypothetical protein n=1 Tax=Mesorhizobium TaxID=68287 RepID=UPI002A24A828|nr:MULTISPECIES: hypothetical protein [unclassified Mesorhizobium]MDX8449115.1 hypothetical protein [Mesorhizobium sp. VK3C]MDX8463634.1 hypothetical protein [Mesorhizobium sp. VK2D]